MASKISNFEAFSNDFAFKFNEFTFLRTDVKLNWAILSHLEQTSTFSSIFCWEKLRILISYICDVHSAKE